MERFGWTWQDVRSTPDDVLVRAMAFVDLRVREQNGAESMAREPSRDDAE